MLFPLTPAETAVLEQLKSLKERLQTANIARNGLGYNADKEVLNSLNAEIQAVNAEGETLALSPDLTTAQLKLEFNSQISAKLPGGNADALLTIAEQTVALVGTEAGQRVTGLIQTVLVMLAGMQADPVLNAARAQITMARYKALCDTGLPQSLVEQIMVAEAAPQASMVQSVQGLKSLSGR